ncbi:MAG: NAD-dependent epimerase/dehydratase family protein, partial [Acidobacteria bacterium ACB2]|nr:NAD-dependent epimerase/dehydratase family protein [Acidobacteria bacterium ACB2]
FTAGSRRPKVAVTGGAGFLGSRLVKALALRDEWDVVVLDLAPAPNVPGEVSYRFLDLNLPHADGAVYKLLREEKPDLVVHLAALRSPSKDTTYTHELNSLGALHVLAAASEAKIPRVIMGSTTFVYGARGDNPNYLTEEHPLRADPHDRFVMDFVEAERHARDFQRRHPEAKLAVLRFAQVLAPEIRDYKTRYLEGPAAMTLLGYDPLMQVLHPEDATSALLKAVETPEARGVFNIAADGVVPLSSLLMLYGTLPVPVPHMLAYPLAETAWLLGLGVSPGIHVHYVRYLCCVSNEKAKRVLGWQPAWSTLDAVLSTVRARRSRGRVLDWSVLEETVRRADYRYDQRVNRRPRPAPPGVRPGKATPQPLRKVSA